MIAAKPTVLFVDDEELVLKAIQKLFGGEDCELHIAESARCALEILEKHTVQVVVSDFRMPEMNGAEFLRIVAERWPDAIRMVLSGYADIASLITAINDGAIYKFICKPWKNKQLRETVWAAVNKYRAQEEARTLADDALKQNALLFSQHLDSVHSLTQRNHELENLVEDLIMFKKAFTVMPIPALVFNEQELECMNLAAQELLKGRSGSGARETGRGPLDQDDLELGGTIANATYATSSAVTIAGKGTYRISRAILERHSAQMKTIVLLHSSPISRTEPTSNDAT